ncbi:NAD(P) transhydrogenase subunit alpha [Candidatus Paracaedibacter acanthamoebae]|uniref:proton-translocating NAD(P)(+) transhydrogenase n=1 Tax=Candidatus Odyssella acanthamoebae TaxID=91604 RepID=A0A077AS17_9PROT|nr:NAD(P) transhydrogenase subunit alpha [Candidatus Paracaedibacter acanthamoebae]AIK95962.1 NAD(P) transhydrogenase subunit alpha part 2 [Candidatus Paracaedibacter acanthamoebae]
MEINSLIERMEKVKVALTEINNHATKVEASLRQMAHSTEISPTDPFVIGLTVFILACFVGYYVVWKVTPALHSPLMAVTNAISSVIIVGALIAAGPLESGVSAIFGFIAVTLAAINIFGGFMVTQRMLAMFSKSK